MAAEIVGRIRLSDGTESEFSISKEYGYLQWGATGDRLGRSQPIVNALTEALYEGELFDDERLTCDRCGGPWGEDETCPRCTKADGTPRDPAWPGPLRDEDEA